MPASTIAVAGASRNRSKFGNKCVRAYQAEGWEVVPVHPTEREIEGLAVRRTVADIPVPIDRISVYLPPQTTARLLAAFAATGAEVWFNPGSAGDTVLAAARDLGIAFRAACSIVDIGRSPSEFR